jgi:hypothetical protein
MLSFVRKIVVLSLLATLCLYAQKVQYTKRSRNEVREGPGNYYPLIVVLRAGIEVPLLEVKNGWVKFYVSVFKDRPGESASRPDWWIAKNALIEKPPRGPINKLNVSVQSTKASASAVMAAVRGFAIRYGKINAPVVDSLLAVGDSFTPQEFEQFRQEVQSKVPRTRGVMAASDENAYLQEYESTAGEDGVGLGIAARIASVGLVTDIKVVKYLNLLATMMGEASGAYDVPLKVYVTSEQDPKAFSVPGGYIFVSQGLLKLCTDEAELAGVISHEVMHIVLMHGLKEQYQRRHRIRAEEAFNELDEETGEAADSSLAELEEFTHEAYDVVMKPRLQSYEEEADRGAVVLLLKVGYDPMAVSRMILKVRDAIRATPPKRLEDNPFAHIDYEKRNSELLKYMQKNVKTTSGVKNEEGFRKWMK